MPDVTPIRAFRMQKDQLRLGHTIHPSDSWREASERPPCCNKESAAAYGTVIPHGFDAKCEFERHRY
jgi:hypothetical protein